MLGELTTIELIVFAIMIIGIIGIVLFTLKQHKKTMLELDETIRNWEIVREKYKDDHLLLKEVLSSTDFSKKLKEILERDSKDK